MNRRSVLRSIGAALAAPLLPKALAASEPVLQPLPFDLERVISPPVMYRGPHLYVYPAMRDAFLRAGYPAYMMRETKLIPLTGERNDEFD